MGDSMKHNTKVLLISSIILIVLAAYPIFPNWLSQYFQGDRVPIMLIVGLVSFVACMFLKQSPDRKHYFFKSLLISILFAFCFSLFAIVSEFDSDNISKGWGILFFMMALVGSMIGTELGLRIGSFLRKEKIK